MDYRLTVVYSSDDPPKTVRESIYSPNLMSARDYFIAQALIRTKAPNLKTSWLLNVR